MDLLTPVLIGIGLSMDCFAVSLAVGSTTMSRLSRNGLILALFFGGFQTGMLVAGWAAGISVIGYISAYDH
jgi:putative Mn2+ efflux pump MntP